MVKNVILRVLLLALAFELGSAVGFSSEAHAILNVESLRLKLRKDESVGSVGLSFDRKEGNTDTMKLLAQGQALWLVRDTEIIGLFEREFGTSNGKHDVNRSLGHVRANWPASSKLSYETFGQLEENRFLRLSTRSLLGSGVRQNWFQEETFSVHTGVGAFWSRETLEFLPGTSDAGTQDIWRGNVYLSLNYLVTKEVELSTITYYQPAITSIEDARILNTTLARFWVNQRLNVALTYNLTLDTRPPEQVQPTDQNYGTILSYVF